MTLLWGIVYLILSLFEGEFIAMDSWNFWTVALLVAVIVDTL